MILSGMVKSSLVDYPKRIAGVLFVPGCNYNCFYCHNRSLIDGSHSTLSQNDIADFLEKRIHLLDGIVITGGEPTLQSDLIDYMHSIKQLGYQVKLDTNGSSPLMIKKILQANVCDYFAVDYKAPAIRYPEICGDRANPDAVLETIHLLLEHHADFEVRTTIIPQLSMKDLVSMAKELPIVPRYCLNRYKKPETYLTCDRKRVEETPYTQKQISDFAQVVRSYQPYVTT